MPPPCPPRAAGRPTFRRGPGFHVGFLGRIVEEKGPDHVAQVVVRPTIDQLDFTAARKSDLEEMRRQLYPLTRRLATRLTREQHARRGGALDFRRTVRSSLSTGGVPLETHHRPKRPHRSELVVLCDVSGSVANFAQFTLLFMFALREVFQSMRAMNTPKHTLPPSGGRNREGSGERLNRETPMRTNGALARPRWIG